MRNNKYQFNPESLSFQKVETSLQEIIKKFFSRTAVSIILGIIFFIIAINLTDSPHLKTLKKENRDLLFQYEMLNKRATQLAKQLEALQNRDNNMYRPFFEAQPIPEAVRKAGFGGTNRYAEFKTFENPTPVISAAKKIDVISKQIYIQSKSFDDLAEMIKNKEKMLASIPAIQPVAQKHVTAVGPYGMRFHPILKITRLHAGVDLCAPEGTPVYAAGDGVVTSAKWGRGGIGNYIRINHGFGFKTIYGHLHKMLVKPGQRVKRGDVIALVGTTGISRVNHLHYEVHKNGKPVDPVNYYFNDLTDQEYEQMITILSDKVYSEVD